MNLKKLVPVVLVAAGAAAGYVIYKKVKEKQLEEELNDEVIFEKLYESNPSEEESTDSSKHVALSQEEEGNTEEESWKEEAQSESELSQIQDLEENNQDIDFPIPEELDDNEDPFPNLNDRQVEEIHEYSNETIDNLSNQGDKVDTERPIQHFVTFKDEASLNQFKEKVQQDGYVVTNGEDKLELIVLHIYDINRTKILSNILYIADSAYEFNGTYHGWNTKTVK